MPLVAGILGIRGPRAQGQCVRSEGHPIVPAVRVEDAAAETAQQRRCLTIRRLTYAAEDDVPRLPTVTESIDGAHSIDEEELCIAMKCFLQRRQWVVAHHNAKWLPPTRSKGSQ